MSMFCSRGLFSTETSCSFGFYYCVSLHHKMKVQTSFFLKTFPFKQIVTCKSLSAQSSDYWPCSHCSQFEGYSNTRLTKSLSEQARGLKRRVSLEACPPLPPLSWLFTSQTPLLTPLLGRMGLELWNQLIIGF